MSFVYTIGLGDSLRAHREATGMTRLDQARQFDLSYLTLLAWERKPLVRAQQNNINLVLRKLRTLKFYAKARVNVFRTETEATQAMKQKKKERIAQQKRTTAKRRATPSKK